MIDVCRKYYQGNESELHSIEQFERSYTRDEVIHWYTQESFVYKLVNKALRTEDLEQLNLFRFFIADLSAALAKAQQETIQTVVYRGVRLDEEEFEHIRQLQGQLIAFNGYLSSSRSMDVAKKFAEINTRTISVIFEIDTSESERSVFADISSLSKFPEEQEVLFDIGVVFMVDRVEENEHFWTIRMRATDEGEHLVDEYIEESQREMATRSRTILLGSLLTRMGRWRQAENYFHQLLRQPGEESLADIHHQLGLVAHHQAKFHEARSHLDKACQLLNEPSSSHQRQSAFILCHLSRVCRDEGDHRQALNRSKLAKELFDQLADVTSLDLALSLHEIGESYRGLRNFDQGLIHLEEALNLRQLSLPDHHWLIGETLVALGMLFRMNKEMEKAMNYYLSAMEKFQISLPDDHAEMGKVLEQIGECLSRKGQTDNALQHYELALKIREKCFPADHPSLGETLDHLSNVLSVKGEKSRALELSLQALNIRERVLPFDHPDLLISLNSVAQKSEAMGNNRQALEYFQRVWEMQTRLGSADRQRTERNIYRLRLIQ